MLEIKDLSVQYGKQAPTIEHFNLSMKKGEIISVVGESGSGKTTILRMIAGLEQPDSGEIIIDGKVVERPLLSELSSAHLPEAVR